MQNVNERELSRRHPSSPQRAKKWLGQHFLVDESVLASIVEAAQLTPDDRVLEIGPGHGVLTSALADAVPDGLVLALEKDRDLIDELRERFKHRKNVKIVQGDVLGTPIEGLIPNVILSPPSLKLWKGKLVEESVAGDNERSLDSARDDKQGYKVVANIPYAVTSPIITKFLLGDYRGRAGGHSPRPQSMTMLVQKEVAERLVAEAPDRERGVLTLLVELFGKARIVTLVPPTAFNPPPKVDSAVIHLEIDESKANPETFHRLLKSGFANKRRQLHNSLAGSLHLSPDEAKKLLERAGINSLLRAEQLTLDQWLMLHQVVLKEVYE